MTTYKIHQGKNIKLKGAAAKKIQDIRLPKNIAIGIEDIHGLTAKVIVNPGDYVKAGSAVVVDKNNPEIKVVSAVSGKVASVNRGDRRVLLNIIIETDEKQEVEVFSQYNRQELASLKREDILKNLLHGGLWPSVRQRPFSKIANPNDQPKSIFIHAMNTEPLAGDIDFILEGQQERLQAGLDIIKNLTAGKTHLCFDSATGSAALTQAKNVELHGFSGQHPTGNVSTHIHYIDPIAKGDIVWYIEVQDVLRIADLFLLGIHSGQKIVAVTGEGVSNAVYVRTITGAPVSSLIEGTKTEGKRVISGSVLTGRNIGKDGYLGFYDTQVTVIPEGGKREFLGWAVPGFNKYTFTNTYISSFLPAKEVSLDTDTHGSDRAIVLNNVFDKYVTLDIITFFLIRAIMFGDVEEAVSLGILECDEEDFALCTFACPSKTDVGAFIRQGLTVVEKEA